MPSPDVDDELKDLVERKLLHSIANYFLPRNLIIFSFYVDSKTSKDV